MLHLRCISAFVFLAVVALTAPLGAQGMRVAPIVGVTQPVAGTMTLQEPIPAGAGFDSVAWAHKYQPGLLVGVALEWDRAGRLDWVAQLTGNFSERRIEDEAGNERTCDCTSSVIVSAGFLARTTFPLRESLRLLVAAGPELHFFAGDAVSNADGFAAPEQIEVNPRVVLGGLGSVGLEADVHRRFSLRLQGGYRVIALRHRAIEPNPLAPVSFDEEAKQDVVVSLGLVLRR